MNRIKNLFLALLVVTLLLGCSSSVVDDYLTEIERTTKEIKAATNFEELTTATERLMKWQREHYEELSEELEDNKLKQAEVNRAYNEFMQVGMSRTFEFAQENDSTKSAMLADSVQVDSLS
ncbi:MAG: hypothetical protein IKT82_01490 [Bacteroidaceae bacterium]|nr:hypothetical protein [Bacteroidaceae bacterium]